MAVLVNRTASVKKIGCAFLNFLRIVPCLPVLLLIIFLGFVESHVGELVLVVNIIAGYHQAFVYCYERIDDFLADVQSKQRCQHEILMLIIRCLGVNLPCAMLYYIL